MSDYSEIVTPVPPPRGKGVMAIRRALAERCPDYLEIMHTVAVRGYFPRLDQQNHVIGADGKPVHLTGMVPAEDTNTDRPDAKIRMATLNKLVDKALPDIKSTDAEKDTDLSGLTEEQTVNKLRSMTVQELQSLLPEEPQTHDE